ncbi:MAG: hypothetical protein JNL64_02325 [Blastocatellia bacterium]|jgi:hypothetical protein|nr:hypothetical protein [Blastocatellia bacterium]
MNEEMSLEPDFDLEEFFEEIDSEDDASLEFEAFDEVNEDVEIRTVVMQKNEMIALLCIKTAPIGAAICRVDPREAHPAIQIYDDANAAVEWFTKSLKTSRINGWNIVHDGLPLQG